MATQIKPKRSNVSGNIPTTSNLVGGEVAVNMADRKIWINNGTAVVQIGAGNLPALADVTLATPVSEDVLVYNGTNWTNTDRVNAKTIYETVKNSTASTIAKGTPVYQTGMSGNTVTVGVARADDPSKLAIGVLDQDIAAEAEGRMLILGEIKGVDTSAFAVNDKIYLGSTGGYTNVPPAGAANQFLGVVFRVSSTNGSGYITGTLLPDIVRWNGTELQVWTGTAWQNVSSGGGEVTLDGTQTLTNKTFTDSTFFIQDEADNTKKAQFQLAQISTGTTRSYTLPNATGTIAVLANTTQNFTGNTTFSNATVTVGSSTAASTYGLGTGATTTGVTKAINIGTAGLSGSTTNIAIGSAVSGATTNVTASGTWTYSNTIVGSISGNAATVTNGVVTTGSYSDPSWITSLNYSKLTGTVPTWNQSTTGSAATLTTARTITIGSTGKTFNGSANVSWSLAEIGAYAASNPSGYTSNTGTVTSVGGTGTVSGLTLSGTVTTSGNLTLGGTLAVTASNFASQTANTFLAAPNGSSGTPTFRTLVAADVPTLNQNTTGSAATLTTGRTIAITGDLTYTSGSFNGSANVTGIGTLANSGVTAGTYTKVTVDAKGRVTVGASLIASDIPTLNQNTTGNAATATALETSRTITIGSTGKGFNGTANVSWSLAEIGAQAALGFTPVQQGGGAGQSGNKLYIGWTGSQLALQVDSTNFSSTWPIGVTGNAATATTLATTRTIGGVNFNGSANIDLPGVNTAGNQNTSGSAASVSGTSTAAIPTTALASGTADTTTYLRGDRTWATISGGATLNDDTTTNSDAHYVTLATTTTGSWTSAVVSSTKLYFNPSTGQLNATNFNSLSDANKKTNLVAITSATSIVQQLQGFEFNWKETGEKSAGIIAQQLEVVLPHLVSTSSTGVKSVNYSGIIGYLIEAIKEQQVRIQALEN